MMSLSGWEACRGLSITLYVVFPRPSRSSLAHHFLIDAHLPLQRDGGARVFLFMWGKKRREKAREE